MCSHTLALATTVSQDTTSFLTTNGTSDVGKSKAIETLNRVLLSKYYPVGPSLKLANQNAITEFLNANAICAAYDPSIMSDDLVSHLRTAFDNLTWHGPDCRFDLQSMLHKISYGKGSNAGTGYNPLAVKLGGSELSFCNTAALSFYKYACADVQPRHMAELIRQKTYGTKRVRGSKVICVPKKTSISRLVCPEALADSVFQRAIGLTIESYLYQTFAIHLSSQPEVNKRLAMIGSSDGSKATVDLKGSSDHISMNWLRHVSNPYFMELISRSRSPETFVNGEWVTLDMVSTQGNGYTFPLQTFIFATICKFVGGSPWVFGDDIVIENDKFDKLVAALEQCGFIVNRDKSFNSGNFRESCGGDYYHGYDVRGVYIKRLEVVRDFHVAYNRLSAWSRKHHIPLPRTLLYLRQEGSRLSTEEYGYVCYVPSYLSDAEGFKIKNPYDEKLDSDIQSIVYGFYALKTKTPFMSIKIYRKLYGLNDPAWFSSMLYGADSQGSSTRPRRERYYIKKLTTSTWSQA